ncbi:hypothetical protein SDRG_16664 [Saprolegnia diclina VS20]|uniref:Uncharacterized protein n=1 Tax=Saprolegnia diclina (strain VS20) TaxID=1156394 RepID=T0PWU1_SAPDV|nr:hypothetical protein SDRG_16664 [Saprolegnia diclina VS20]EQC25475.1 hypothetical protein SDRG_16664 [Saprolegnia diclina VS20]|eukprot:XP_008621103.1 hypothetical protein SDRG_16664 [Saprolegnia diclina VS20]
MASCKYGDVGVDVVLTADGSCADGTVICVVDSNCAVRHEVAANSTRFELRSGWRLGDFSRYPHPHLELVDLDIDSSLHRYQQMPSGLQGLAFTSSILASETTTTALSGLALPRGLRHLSFEGCYLGASVNLNRFRRLEELSFRNTTMFEWPWFVPSTLRHLSAFNSTFHKLNDLGKLSALETFLPSELSGITQLFNFNATPHTLRYLY